MTVEEQRARQLVREMAEQLDERGAWWRQRIAEVAGDRDDMRLKLINDHVALLDKHIEELRLERDCAAQRLRDQGVPMTKIATLAGVSDSYLAKRLFSLGSKRKFIRKGGALIATGILGLSCSLPVASAAGQYEREAEVPVVSHFHADHHRDVDNGKRDRARDRHPRRERVHRRRRVTVPRRAWRLVIPA